MRALMTRKWCAVEMCNAILGNHLKGTPKQIIRKKNLLLNIRGKRHVHVGTNEKYMYIILVMYLSTLLSASQVSKIILQIKFPSW